MDWTQSEQFTYQQYLYYQTVPNQDNTPMYGMPTPMPQTNQYDPSGLGMALPQPRSTATNGQCGWQQQHLMLECAGLKKKKYANLQQNGQNSMQLQQPPLPNPNMLHLPSGTVPFPNRQPALPQKWHSHCARGCDYCWSSPKNKARYAQHKAAQEQANAQAGASAQQRGSTAKPTNLGQRDSQPMVAAGSQEVVPTQYPGGFCDPTSTSSSQSMGQCDRSDQGQCHDAQLEELFNEIIHDIFDE